LAVSANDNRIKILATVDGLCLMRTFEGHSLVASRLGIASEALIKVSNFLTFISWLDSQTKSMGAIARMVTPETQKV
jgi:hypothetical protein